MPDWVTVLTTAPANSPYRTSYGATSTWYSFTASSGTDFPEFEAAETLPFTKRSSAPLIRKLLKRRFAPAAETPVRPPPILLDTSGASATKS